MTIIGGLGLPRLDTSWASVAADVDVEVMMTASSHKSQPTSIKPQASSLKHQASSIKHQASSIKPQATGHKPQATTDHKPQP